MSRVWLVCKECGSRNVTADAVARWDAARQEWELSTELDNRTCEDCSADGTSILDEIPVLDDDAMCIGVEEFGYRMIEGDGSLWLMRDGKQYGEGFVEEADAYLWAMYHPHPNGALGKEKTAVFLTDKEKELIKALAAKL